MSFEYYSKGDLLLCDSGEVKNWVPGYGPTYAKGHNTILVSNQPGGHLGGPIKGLGGTYYNRAYLKSWLIKPYFEFVEAYMRWRYIEKCEDCGDYYYAEALENPLDWHRLVLYPNREYFVVVDLLNGNQTREIDTLFHLSSLKTVRTRGSYAHITFQGYVVGNLTVEGKGVDWVKQRYGVRVKHGEGNLVEWETLNITGKPVKLMLFSVPRSNITVERFWCRVGGYSLPDEVTHPIIRYRVTSPSMHRVTLLLSMYPGSEPQVSELAVANGSAVKLVKDNIVDLIYAGSGSASFEGLSTDGEVTYYRYSNETPKLLTMIRGTYLHWDGSEIVALSEKAEYLSASYEPDVIQLAMNSSSPNTVRLYAPNASRVEIDGSEVTFNTEGPYITFNVPEGVHEPKVYLSAATTITTTTTTTTTETTPEATGAELYGLIGIAVLLILAAAYLLLRRR